MVGTGTEQNNQSHSAQGPPRYALNLMPPKVPPTDTCRESFNRVDSLVSCRTAADTTLLVWLMFVSAQFTMLQSANDRHRSQSIAVDPKPPDSDASGLQPVVRHVPFIQGSCGTITNRRRQPSIVRFVRRRCIPQRRLYGDCKKPFGIVKDKLTTWVHLGASMHAYSARNDWNQDSKSPAGRFRHCIEHTCATARKMAWR